MSPPFSQHERSLFVIEQPGKLTRLAVLLRKAGFTNFEIQPTYGALLDLSDEAIAINPISLTATWYEVKKRPVVQKLQALAAEVSVIYVMTDADREGELIAAQVKQLCSGKPVLRMRMRAMTPEALKEALSQPVKLDVGAATAAAARRIIDRIIGYGFSDHNPNRRGASGVVGRVLTAALSAFSRSHVACGEWSGRIGSFEAQGTITNRTIEDARRLETFLKHSAQEIERLPKERITRLVAPPPPCHYADAVLEARRRLGIPVPTAERILQDSYERGYLSYVRTDSTHLGPETRAMALKLARDARLSIAKDADHIHLPQTDVVGRKHAHEALHPTMPVDLSLDPGGQDKHDGLLTIIARRLAMAVAAPAEVESERISQPALKTFLANRLGESAADIDLRLTRDVSVLPTWMNWLKRNENASLLRVEVFEPDATVLTFLAGSHFGRPSNQIYLTQKLLRNRLVDEIGNVTAVGHQNLAYARERAPFLLDIDRIERFEQILDSNQSNSVQGLVGQLCDAMGVPRQLAQSAVYSWYAARHIPTPTPTPNAARAVSHS